MRTDVNADVSENTLNALNVSRWWLPAIMLLITLPVWSGRYEPRLFYWLNQHLALLPDLFWSLLCLLGTAWCAIALTFPLLLRAPRMFMAWVCAAPVAGVFARIGKMLPNNPRPLEALGLQSIHVIGEPVFIAAMPSGHTLTAFAVASALYFSAPRSWKFKTAWLFVAGLGVALSRIAVGAHWPADVAVGAALGVFSGLVGSRLSELIPAHSLLPQSWWVRSLACVATIAVYVLATDNMGFEQNLVWQYGLCVFLCLHLVQFLLATTRHRWSGGA
jgi:membrane-associated phospholipid phosphatase